MLIMQSSADTKKEILQERGVTPDCSHTKHTPDNILRHHWGKIQHNVNSGIL